MTYAQVKAYINQFIITNGNNEITAIVLNPILQAITDMVLEITGDKSTLSTTNKKTLVEAINEVYTAIGSIGNNSPHVYTGVNDPNTTPPPIFTIGDFYIQTDPFNEPIALFLYDGVTWVNISIGSSPNLSDYINDVPFATVAQTTLKFIKSNENLSLANRKVDTLYGILDQYTGEEITLSKVTVTPTVDGIIYFQLGSEYFIRNFTDGVNIKWFGAKGDGVTDDTSSLQASLNYLKRNRVSLFAGTMGANSSLKLYVPHGVYILTSAIKIPNAIEIQGESENGTRFRTYNRSIELFSIEDVDDVALGDNTIYTTIRNLSIWGYHSDRNPFEYKDAPIPSNVGLLIKRSKVRLENCHVAGFEGASVVCDGVYYVNLINCLFSHSTRGLYVSNTSTSIFATLVEIRFCSEGVNVINSYACYFNQCMIENNIGNFLPAPDFDTIPISESKAIGVVLRNSEDIVFNECYFEAQVVNVALYASKKNVFQNSIFVPLYSEEVTARQFWFLQEGGVYSTGNKFSANTYKSFDVEVVNPYYVSGNGDMSSNIFECLDSEQFEAFVAVYEASTTITCQSANIMLENGVRRKMDGLRSYFGIYRPSDDIIYNTIFNKDDLTLNYFDGDNWLELNYLSFVNNNTTTALSKSYLDTTYPTQKLGFEVHCPLIVAKPTIYKKTQDNWLELTTTLVL